MKTGSIVICLMSAFPVIVFSDTPQQEQPGNNEQDRRGIDAADNRDFERTVGQYTYLYKHLITKDPIGDTVDSGSLEIRDANINDDSGGVILADKRLQPPGCSTMDAITVLKEPKPGEGVGIVAICGSYLSSANTVVVYAMPRTLATIFFGRRKPRVEYFNAPPYERLVIQSGFIFRSNAIWILVVKELRIQPTGLMSFDERHFEPVFGGYASNYYRNYYLETRSAFEKEVRNPKDDSWLGIMLAALMGMQDTEYSCQEIRGGPLSEASNEQMETLIDEFTKKGLPNLNLKDCTRY